MKAPAPEHHDGTRSETREPVSTWLKVFFLVEVSAAAIGLLMPITPSKTGSDRDLSDWFLEDPTYLQQALFDFACVNLLILVFGLAVWVYTVWKRRGEDPRP